MTAKEAIHKIKEHNRIHNLNERNAVFITRAFNMAIKALEKQLPKKPDIYGDGYDDDGNIIYDTYDCPNCQKSYEIEYEEYDYCPNCGQALNWSDDND